MTHSRFIELLTKEFSDQLIDNEREELEGLLAAHPQYQREREMLVAFWQREKGEYATSKVLFGRVLEKIRIMEAGEDEAGPAGVAPQGIGRRRVRIWYGAAAAVVFAVVAVGYFSHRGVRQPAPARAVAVHWLKRTTRPSQKDSVRLADGTLVRLNSASSLSYPDVFTGSTRQVHLDGEAFFDVSKDAAHPFLISTDKMNIRVLGTSFDVKSYRNETVGETTLIQGSIEVTLADRPADRFILKPKEKLVVENKLATKRPADTTASGSTRYSLANLTYYPNPARTVVETGWLENKLVFSGKDFDDLSGQLERWYDVRIEFRNERVRHYNFTGIIEKETLREALDALKMIEPFRYEIADSTVYIY
ncbi:FecR domain-containing protein [Puia sp.]|jgi:ferric-dicitrate binding protein FerR (iron transport regulator)|uniref:FecR domain-containing protein n=1 Tax=Puia sp. TaxID=2045100 RepID=UPI002F425B00